MSVSPRLVAFVACSGLLFTRGWHRVVRPQLWAEDGPVFLTHAYQQGVRSLFEPYSGYQHLGPRLLALLASALPLAMIPTFLASCCLLILAWCLSEPMSSRFTALRGSPLVPSLVCLALVSLPALTKSQEM